jgi:hypothetical protein
MIELVHDGPAYSLLPATEKRLESNDVDLNMARQMLRKVCQLFPELSTETVYVGVTHGEISYHGEPFAMADPYNMMIFVQADNFREYQVLFHELEHLVIEQEDSNGKDVPVTSEEYCSIRAVARMPPDMVYRDDIAYLGEPDAPKEEWPDICQRALEYREEKRNYIQKCKEWLEIDA